MGLLGEEEFSEGGFEVVGGGSSALEHLFGLSLMAAAPAALYLQSRVLSCQGIDPLL